MSTETLSKLRSDALSLPDAERAELAHALVTSLDAPADCEARANPYRLIGDMAGAYSRRINIQHRLA